MRLAEERLSREEFNRKDLLKYIGIASDQLASDDYFSFRAMRTAEFFAGQLGEDRAAVRDKIYLKAVEKALSYEQIAPENPDSRANPGIYRHSKQHFRDTAKKLGRIIGIFKDLNKLEGGIE